jgi:hypothetical protein
VLRSAADRRGRSPARAASSRREFLEEIDLDDLAWGTPVTEDQKVNDRFWPAMDGAQSAFTRCEKELEKELEKVTRGDELPPGVVKLVKVYIAKKRKLSVGDKMAGRTATRASWPRSSPRGPAVPAGRDADRNRAQPARRAVAYEHRPGAGDAPRLGGACTRLQLRDAGVRGRDGGRDQERAAPAGLPEDGKTVLYDGRMGESFDERVCVGYIYMMKLSHLVDDKIHARSTGPYSLGHPAAAGRQGAVRTGQRFRARWSMGASSLWARPTTRSQELTHRQERRRRRAVAVSTRRIVKGENPPEPGVPSRSTCSSRTPEPVSGSAVRGSVSGAIGSDEECSPRVERELKEVMIQETDCSRRELAAGKLGLRADERDQSGAAGVQLHPIRLASPDVIRAWVALRVPRSRDHQLPLVQAGEGRPVLREDLRPGQGLGVQLRQVQAHRYRGVICDRCGVEVTQAKVRRERLGHIELAVPVSHIWFFKGVPSRIGHLLDMSIRDLERILYYESYVVIDPGNTGFKKREIISEDQYNEVMDEQPDSSLKAKMGAEAIRDLLSELDLEELSTELARSPRWRPRCSARRSCSSGLRIVEAFRHSGNRPEWMILECSRCCRRSAAARAARGRPVRDVGPQRPLPARDQPQQPAQEADRHQGARGHPAQREAHAAGGGRRAVRQRPRSRAVRGQGNRPLKSLSDMLKGKQGRFRQNLLGKRVDYSGRSVIVVGPELKLNQCGLPKNMALELFKPFIIRKLEDRGYVQTVKSAKRLVEREKPEVWDILGEIIENHPVLLNRAPTLHRLGIQGFEPVLVEGKAIRSIRSSARRSTPTSTATRWRCTCRCRSRRRSRRAC